MLPMTHRFGGDGEVITSGIDIAQAPVPPRRYVCDIADIKVQDGDIRLVFAQRTLGEDALDSALVIRLNPVATWQLLKSLGEMQFPGVQGIADQLNIGVIPLTPVTARPSQMASVVANLVGIAVAGFETCLDFYHASAFSIRAAKSASQIAVEPVVRVDMQTGLFLSWVEALREIAQKHLPRQSEE